jgi:hypothetical protein
MSAPGDERRSTAAEKPVPPLLVKRPRMLGLAAPQKSSQRPAASSDAQLERIVGLAPIDRIPMDSALPLPA